MGYGDPCHELLEEAVRARDEARAERDEALAKLADLRDEFDEAVRGQDYYKRVAWGLLVRRVLPANLSQKSPRGLGPRKEST